MKLKHFPRINFLEAKSTPNLSKGWKDVVFMKALLRLEMGKEVRNGEMTSIWEDKWMHGLKEVLEEFKPPNNILYTVNHLIDPTIRWWKASTIQ